MQKVLLNHDGIMDNILPSNANYGMSFRSTKETICHVTIRSSCTTVQAKMKWTWSSFCGNPVICHHLENWMYVWVSCLHQQKPKTVDFYGLKRRINFICLPLALTHKQLGIFPKNVLFSNFAYHKCNAYVWNWFKAIDTWSALADAVDMVL